MSLNIRRTSWSIAAAFEAFSLQVCQGFAQCAAGAGVARPILSAQVTNVVVWRDCYVGKAEEDIALLAIR